SSSGWCVPMTPPKSNTTQDIPTLSAGGRSRTPRPVCHRPPSGRAGRNPRGQRAKRVAAVRRLHDDGVMTWTAPKVMRTEPPTVAGERASLEACLPYPREPLLFKCQGLTGEQLARRAVAPSSLSLLGLVRHMAEV